MASVGGLELKASRFRPLTEAFDDTSSHTLKSNAVKVKATQNNKSIFYNNFSFSTFLEAK